MVCLTGSVMIRTRFLRGSEGCHHESTHRTQHDGPGLHTAGVIVSFGGGCVWFLSSSSPGLVSLISGHDAVSSYDRSASLVKTSGVTLCCENSALCWVVDIVMLTVVRLSCKCRIVDVDEQIAGSLWLYIPVLRSA